jgi:hypothetical protein
MISIKNSYDNNKYVNELPIPLPFRGYYEDLNNFFGMVISCFSTKSDTLYVDYLNTLQNNTSELDVSGVIRDTYDIIPNKNNLFIVEPKLRYFRIKLVTDNYEITDIRKVNTYLIGNGIPFAKIYGSEQVPIKTDSSGNLQVGVIGGINVDISGIDINLDTTNNLITTTNEILTDLSGTQHTDLMMLHTDISGSNTLLNTIHTDISGSNTLLNTVNTNLNTIHTDISGSNTLLNRFNFDISNNLQVVENLNFSTNTALYSSRYHYLNIIGNSGGLSESGISGTRDLVDGVTAVIYTFPSTVRRIRLVSSSVLDNSTYKIQIVGLDASYNQINEVLSLNGTTFVTSVNTYLRLNSLYVVQSDTTYATSFTNSLNGLVTINDASGSAYGTIDPVSGIRCAAVYTVPLGYKLIVTNLNMSDQTATTCTLFIYSRQNGGVTQHFILNAIYYYNNGQRDIDISNSPLIFNSQCDILFRITTGNNGKAFCNIGAMLCKI